MSKKIGIPGWKTGENSFGVTVPYLEYIRKFGQAIILFPDDPVRNDLDLLFLPGGMDVSPSTINSQLSMHTGNSNAMLEYFDMHRLPDYIQQGTKIFGVCRGAQRLWAMFGGKLQQHIYLHTQSEYPTDECHCLSWNSEEYSKKYSKLVKKVNSRHHQSMDAYDNIPDELDVIAYSKEDKYVRLDIVEIFKHKTLPIYGTQYHPEDCPTERVADSIINELLYEEVVKQNEQLI